MKKTDFIKLAKKLILLHAPNHGTKIGFFDSMHHGILGIASFARNTIFIDRTILHVAPKEFLEQVVLHELAHILTGKELTFTENMGKGGHGPTWQKNAEKIGCTTGSRANLPAGMGFRLEIELLAKAAKIDVMEKEFMDVVALDLEEMIEIKKKKGIK